MEVLALSHNSNYSRMENLGFNSNTDYTTNEEREAEAWLFPRILSVSYQLDLCGMWPNIYDALWKQTISLWHWFSTFLMP